jgi:two-component system response regulator DesR
VAPSPAGDAAPATVAVLIVDPHAKVRAAIAAVLGREPGVEVVASVGGFDDALAAVRFRRPDVVLLDTAALGPRGFGGVAALRRSSTAILVMGVVHDRGLAREAVRHGAVARVMKDTPAPELAVLVRAAASGRLRLRIVRSRDEPDQPAPARED